MIKVLAALGLIFIAAYEIHRTHLIKKASFNSQGSSLYNCCPKVHSQTRPFGLPLAFTFKNAYFLSSSIAERQLQIGLTGHGWPISDVRRTDSQSRPIAL
jgi:hypothetical protein